MKIAIGPSRDRYPSWEWCAQDLIPDMAKLHDFTVFRRFSELDGKSFDLLMVVKQPPPAEAKIQVNKIIYMPVDYFKNTSDILNLSNFLQSCNLIAVHCSRLSNHLKPYCNEIAFIEHYDKLVLDKPSPFRPEGFALWTGQHTYAPLICEWFTKTDTKFPLTMLTSVKKIPPHFKNIPKLTFLDWSQSGHMEFSRNAKAGLDLKGPDFHQQAKPPLKIQQFVASGIPSAVNRDSYTWEYFHDRGFDLATPDDKARWFSQDYWNETNQFAPQLRESIKKTNVIQSYLDLIERA